MRAGKKNGRQCSPASQKKKGKKNPFYYSHSEDLPLFSEPQIIFAVASEGDSVTWLPEPKGQGQVGGVGGARGGCMEGTVEDRWKEREVRGWGGGEESEEGMGKGGHGKGEKCQTESKLQRAVSAGGAAVCLAAPEANNEAAGQKHGCRDALQTATKPPTPPKKKKKKILNIHPPSPAANTSPPFDICFSL